MFFLFIHVALEFLVFTQIEASIENMELAHILIAIAVPSILIGMLTIWISLLKVSGNQINEFMYVHIFSVIFTAGILFSSVEIFIIDGIWEVEFSPRWILPIIIPPIIALVLRLVYLMMSYNYPKYMKEILLLRVGWFLIFLGFVVVSIQRVVGGDPFAFFLFYSSGLAAISSAISRNPLIIIPKKIGGKYFILSTREGGTVLYETSFGDNELLGILSTAIRAAIEVLAEARDKSGGTSTNSLPKFVNFLDSVISIVETDMFVAYFFSDKYVSYIGIAISEILNDLEKKNSSNGGINMISNEIEKFLRERLRHDLEFAIE